MGAWGYYDNQNDGVLDEFFSFKLNFIKDNNKDLYQQYKKNKFSYDDEMDNTLEIFLVKNRVKAAKYLKLYIDKIINNNFSVFTFVEYDNRNIIIVGLIIELLYLGKSPKFRTSLPKTLFDKFPTSLKKLACTSINKSLMTIDKENWSDNKKRIIALKAELKLFRCVSSTKIINEKVRKGPSESATQFNVGIKKIGNDGNMWIITKNKNNIKRWSKT